MYRDPSRYNSGYFIGSFIRCTLVPYIPADPDYEKYLKLCLDIALKIPLEEVPLHVNDEFWLAIELTKWRLTLGR